MSWLLREGDVLATAEVAVRRLRSLVSELGEVPALSHDLAIAGTNEEIAWQLCELAPLNLMDRQALLASLTLEEIGRRTKLSPEEVRSIHELVVELGARADRAVAQRHHDG